MFSYNKALARYHRNMIKALQDNSRQRHIDDNAIRNILLDHVQNLLTTASINTHLLAKIEVNTLNANQINNISKPISDQEIHQAAT